MLCASASSEPVPAIVSCARGQRCSDTVKSLQQIENSFSAQDIGQEKGLWPVPETPSLARSTSLSARGKRCRCRCQCGNISIRGLARRAQHELLQQPRRGGKQTVGQALL